VIKSVAYFDEKCIHFKMNEYNSLSGLINLFTFYWYWWYWYTHRYCCEKAGVKGAALTVVVRSGKVRLVADFSVW